MPISAVIVDDEKLARDELAFLLNSIPDVEVLAQGQNGLDAVKLVSRHQPDLLILDAQMPGLDGFGAVKMMEAKHLRMPFLVFATAYDHYALQAFEVNAVDYLLKPFDRERLARTIDRVRRHVHAGDSVVGKIDRVLEMLGSQKPQPTARILVRSSGRQYLLDPHEIIYARIDDGVITVVTAALEGQATCRTIEELQAGLDPAIFWRAHRSFLANLNHIKEVVPWFNSSYQLRMDDKKQTEIPVSRAQSRRLRELYKL